ncbi:hypothetical protein BDV29DRAFT_135926 [Aspergillus leporis]|uniref:Uncharacterized protein n=1 Tax=Aspergillus leporis TaxID=41062 RepID=A0A5N5X1T9_9EURO|nr:hypothetical protein BDV29DRAFT_135926 [Aspergillus leporis]
MIEPRPELIPMLIHPSWIASLCLSNITIVVLIWLETCRNFFVHFPFFPSHHLPHSLSIFFLSFLLLLSCFCPFFVCFSFSLLLFSFGPGLWIRFFFSTLSYRLRDCEGKDIKKLRVDVSSVRICQCHRQFG